MVNTNLFLISQYTLLRKIILHVTQSRHYLILKIFNLTALDLSDASEIASYKGIMTEYDRYLRSRLRGRYIKKGVNDHSLQFSYCGIGVDLLMSPYFDSKQQYYRFLETVDRNKISL